MVTMSEKDPETEKDKEHPLSSNSRKSVSQELDKFKRRMIRSVARLIHKEKKDDEEVWKELKKETGSECRILWIRMRALTVKKLQRLLLADDQVGCIPSVARMNVTDWLLFDLVLVHDKIDVIGRTQDSKRECKALGELFNLVQRFNIEELTGEELLDSWTAAVNFYNKGRLCSPMLLQKRWYQLKEMTRHNFYLYWHSYRGNAKLIERAKPLMPGSLQIAIATRFPHVITKPFENWEELINKRKVIMPEEFESRGSRDLPNPCSDDNPDLILLEPHVETIDLGDASDDDDTGNRKENSEMNSKTKESDIRDLEIIKDTEDLNSNINIKNEPIDIDDNEIEDQLSKSDRLMLQEDENLYQIENAYIEEHLESHKDIETETVPENTQESSKLDDEIIEMPSSINKNTDQVAICEKTDKSKQTFANKPDDDVCTSTETTIDLNYAVGLVSQNENISQTLTDAPETSIEIPEATFGTPVKAIELPETAIETPETAIETPEIDIETSETAFETHLPLITNVIGNVDIERDNLSKVNAPNDNFDVKLSTTLCNDEPQVIEDEDDVEDIIQVTNYDKPVQDVKLKTNLVQSRHSKDEINEKSEKSNSKELEANKLEVTTNVDPTVETFTDDDIEFVDDGIVEVDSENSSLGTDKNEENNENKETSPAFDLKLLMNPVIYTTKLDQMVCLKDKPSDFLLDTITVPHILDEINAQSKPKSKKTVVIKIEKEVCKTEPEDDITATDELFVNQTDTVMSDDDDNNLSDESEDIGEHLKVKRTSSLFKKPVNRQYHPIQLCKNPDFNTRLKRLNIGFYGYTRNIRLLKFCKPVTVDVFKAFEAKLINNTIYLKAEENDDKIVDVISDKGNVQVTNITPSAVPVQSLVNSTETDANSFIAEFKAIANNTSYNNISEKFKDHPNSPKSDIVASNASGNNIIEKKYDLLNLPEDKSNIKTSSMAIDSVDIKLNNDITAKSQDVSNSTKQQHENDIDISGAPKYVKLDKKRSTLTQKYTNIMSQLHSHKIMSEFSQKNPKKPSYRPSTERKGAKWLSHGLKPPAPQLDDFLLAPDTLTKMLVVMNGGRSLTFKEWSNIRSKIVRNEKSNTNTEPLPKTGKVTSTTFDNKINKYATKEHSEGDINCTCITCIENCSCPACLRAKEVKRGPRPRCSKSKIVPEKQSVQEMNAKSIRKAEALLKKQNTNPSSQENLPKSKLRGPKKSKLTQVTTPVDSWDVPDTQETNNKIKSKLTQVTTPVDSWDVPDTQETNNQRPVAHIRILPKKINVQKRNSIGVQADQEKNTESIPANNKINLSLNGKPPGDGKVRHIIIDGTKPLPNIPKSTIPNKNKNPIYLGKNKILMTTTKFPPDLDGGPDHKALPLSYTNLLHPNLQLPSGVNLEMSPNGVLSFAIDSDAVITAQQYKMLPIFLETMQKLLTPSMIGNLDSTENATSNNSHNSSDEIVISDDEENLPRNGKEDDKDKEREEVEIAPVINFDGTQENTQINAHFNKELSDTVPAQNAVEMQSLRNVSEELNIIENDSQAQANNGHEIIANDDGESKENDEMKKSSDIITVPEENEDTTANITENSEAVSEVHHSNNQKTDNSGTSVNRKSLLSDLMEMSGISIEDVLPATVTNKTTQLDLESKKSTNNVNEIIDISAEQTLEENAIQQIKARLPETEEVPLESQIKANITTVKSLQAELEYTPNSSINKTVPKMYELNIVSSYAKLKYVCDNGGDFFKLDLDSGFISKINVCIKKKTVVKKNKISCEPIDLTDEPDLSVDLSENQNNEKEAAHTASTIRVRNNLFPQSDGTYARRNVPVQFVRKVTSNVTSLPNIIRKKTIWKKNYYESTELSLVMKHDNRIKTMRARIRQPLTKSLHEEINLVFSDTESDMEPSLERRHKVSDDAVENTENLFEVDTHNIYNGVPVRLQSNINLQSDDDSDDEPLAKKAKRIHGSDDNDTQSRGVTTIVSPENYPNSNPHITDNIPDKYPVSISNAPTNVNVPENYPVSIINAPNIPKINSDIPVLPLPEAMGCEVLETTNPVTYFVPGVAPVILGDDEQNDDSMSNGEDCILGF